ncbi:MAG TPA: CBS domain-containing protein [Pirellulales bacterium]|jgi:CBS domain-containing protein|nr:CBS domain-containing protein [Pirellulales bacterium]
MPSDLTSLRAEQIMTRPPISAAPGQSLAELVTLLIENRIGGLPVVEDGRLVGVISRSDIVRVQVLMKALDGRVTDELGWVIQADGFKHAATGEFKGFRDSLASLTVADAMRDEVFTCTADTSAAEVADIMVRRHVHRVIVVEEERPVGIISSLDLVKLLATAAGGA